MTERDRERYLSDRAMRLFACRVQKRNAWGTVKTEMVVYTHRGGTVTSPTEESGPTPWLPSLV